ncbi:uncharacterized protein [Bemisia tabaci]
MDSRLYTYADYTPCPYCLGFILKKNLSQHTWNCVGVSAEMQKRKAEGHIEDIISKSEALLGNCSAISIDQEFYQNIMTRMKDDEITGIVKNDTLILHLGAFLYAKFNVTQKEYIRQSMRMLARFLLEIQSIDEKITSLPMCFDPGNFDHILQAVQHLCIAEKRNLERVNFQKAALLLKLGPLLKKTSTLHRGMCLRQLNSEDPKVREEAKQGNNNAKNFIELMELEWKTRLSSTALSNLKERKYNCGELLPLTEDLMKLRAFVDAELNRVLKELKESITIPQSRYFSELLLVSVILFNKKRTGEAAKMKPAHYEKRPNWHENSADELKAAMSPLERKLGENMAVLDIRGKHDRSVPVVLTKEMQEGIEFLLKHRTQIGINKNNPYIFAIAGFDEAHLRGHDCVRKICGKLPLVKPRLIQGTKLRKYIATVTQILNLSTNETDWLARHLGHDIAVHRDFYRLHDSAIEATKVSRILLAVDSGQVNKFAGKKLNEINLNDLPDLDSEQPAVSVDVFLNDDNEVCENEPVASEPETRNTLLANTQQNEELGNVNENGPYENVPPPDCETVKRVSKRKKDISKELPHSEKENPKKPKRKPPLRTRNQKIEDDSDSYEPSSDGDSEKEYEEIAKKRSKSYSTVKHLSGSEFVNVSHLGPKRIFHSFQQAPSYPFFRGKFSNFLRSSTSRWGKSKTTYLYYGVSFCSNFIFSEEKQGNESLRCMQNILLRDKENQGSFQEIKLPQKNNMTESLQRRKRRYVVSHCGHQCTVSVHAIVTDYNDIFLSLLQSFIHVKVYIYKNCLKWKKQ